MDAFEQLAADHVLQLLTSTGLRAVAACGGRGGLRKRSAKVRPLLVAPFCLGTTRRGEPRHPLYVPRDTRALPLP